MFNDNDVLGMFLLGYMSSGHTATDVSMNWLINQIEEFMGEWQHGLDLGFLPPLMVCLYKVNHATGSEEHMPFFTQRYEKVWFNHLVKKYQDEFETTPTLTIL